MTQDIKANHLLSLNLNKILKNIKFPNRSIIKTKIRAKKKEATRWSLNLKRETILINSKKNNSKTPLANYSNTISSIMTPNSVFASIAHVVGICVSYMELVLIYLNSQHMLKITIKNPQLPAKL